MADKILRISVLSLFYIALVLHGLQRMSGLFITEISKIKNVTNQDAAVPFIYCWAVSKIVSSFSGYMTDDKSSELVVFFGALLCIIGTALCILDTDVTTMTVFWGFIFGSGYGLALPHLTRDLFLSNVDSNKLSVFQEISASFGISIMPLILNILISQYGVQGSFIMFSGIILQYIPFALASSYNIQIRIPTIKWKVRKKSQHSVSEQKKEKAIAVGSFSNNLEPDFVQKVNENDNYYRKILIDSPTTFSKKKFCTRRKRSETKGNDLQGFEINHVTSTPERKSCKKIENISEESCSNACVIDIGLGDKKLEKIWDLTFETTNIFTSDKSSLKHDYNLKYDILKNTYQNQMKDADHKKKKIINKFCGNDIVNDQTVLAHTCIKDTSVMITGGSKNCTKQQIKESVQNEQRISFNLGQGKTSSLTSHKIKSQSLLGKEIPVLSLQLHQNEPIPLGIKIHVEEYTFTVDSGQRGNFDSSYSEDKVDDEINNSQSRTLQKGKYINFPNPNSSENTLEDLNGKSNLRKLYPSSNKSKFNYKIFSKNINKSVFQNINKNELKMKFISILKFSSKLISPGCLCIIMFTITFETTLIILLTNIGDFVSTRDRVCYECILVAFGVGGLFGKLCCCKISRTISKRSHSFGVVLFLLNGLSIAGVLYSPNQSWLTVFYSILGALEGGISYVLRKFISDYTYKQVHHMMSSMQCFFSGVAVISLPFVIDLLPDEMDDYEFLLQTLSCLSVLCAIFAYFLPCLRHSVSNKKNISVY